MRILFPALCTLFAAAFCPITAAMAVERNITNWASAAGDCQSALPSFEGQLRKRPLAIQNEGTTTAFVTCAPGSFAGGNDGFELAVANYGPSPVVISCTMVRGFVSPIGATMITQSVSIAGGHSGHVNDFIDFAPGIQPDSVSCQLPPGAGINRLCSYLIFDVGA